MDDVAAVKRKLYRELRMIKCMVACVDRDLERFLDKPDEYDAAEYFGDVSAAASEVNAMLDVVVDLLKQLEKAQ